MDPVVTTSTVFDAFDSMSAILPSDVACKEIWENKIGGMCM